MGVLRRNLGNAVAPPVVDAMDVKLVREFHAMV